MTVRSLPITIGDEDLELRFTQPDVIRAEVDYQVGYVYFFEKKYASMNLYRLLFYHGLKVRTRAGTLERRCATKEEAGELVGLFLTEHYPEELAELMFFAFLAGGWVKDPKIPASESVKETFIGDTKN
jgi:hypothetical protein